MTAELWRFTYVGCEKRWEMTFGVPDIFERYGAWGISLAWNRFNEPFSGKQKGEIPLNRQV